MAAPGGGEDVYASILLTDTYLPGALVLAHSLRDAGTDKKLAVLVALDSVSADVITQLKAVYDYVIPVPRIRNETPANLDLMNRRDLHSAFTKINLWKQTQFRRIVYLDADVVAYRAPDELFSLPHAFAAAPDIGWPDLFNTGVMVLTPNMGDYYALKAMAEKGVSFDGADQGLLNMYFKNDYHRLSFIYNVTPSAHYQYIPAYRHFSSSINMVHFIGVDKPWVQGRHAHTGSSPFNEMVSRWWAVYDRHYSKEARERAGSDTTTQEGVPEIVQYFVQGEYQPKISYVIPVGEPPQETGGESHGQDQGHQEGAPQPPPSQPEHTPEPPQPPPAPSWDAQRQPPPSDSQPEAFNFPQTHYEMSSDPAPFVPPQRYPSPPKNMWYEVPKEQPPPPSQKPRPIFPWEVHQPRPTRVFGDDPKPAEPPSPSSSLGASGSSSADHHSEPKTPTTPTGPVAHSNPWTTFTRTNAWDEVPEIDRYVSTLQKHRRKPSQGLRMSGLPAPGLDPDDEAAWSGRGSRVTDFPSEVDRPSLPVTPAPIRRPRFWGGGGPGFGLGSDEDEEHLPAAEGVPAQTEWDPVAQLQKLAKQQSELLLQKLGGSGSAAGGSSELPPRPLPFGSEDARSPTYVARSAAVLSPQPVKPSSGTSSVRSIISAEHEAIPRSSRASGPSGEPASSAEPIPKPSYQGPCAAFEKGEDFSTSRTPALPSEEEQDVLDT